MITIKSARILLLILVALFVIAIGIWSLVQYTGLQASLLWTTIIGAAAWLIRSNVERRREYERLLADRKREHYLQFLEFLSKFVGPPQSNESNQSVTDTTRHNSPVPLEELRMWSLRLTLIGSDDVVEAWNVARGGSANDSKQVDSFDNFRNWGRLWLAMRKDCGHMDTQLKVADVLASFVNDIEQHRTRLDY